MRRNGAVGDGNTASPTFTPWSRKALRAQLASLSFVTGQLYIELDFHPDHVPEGSDRAHS